MASRGVPPMKVTKAGAVAIAKPPIPDVSVITLSPISGHASASVNPGKYKELTFGASAVNH